MKLILRVVNDSTLQLVLQDLVSPIVKQLSPDERHVKSLQQYAESYQAIINQPNNMDALYTLGYQLFELLNHHAGLMAKWLNTVGMRQLEIHTTHDANPLQHLLSNLPWEVMVYNNQFLAADTVLYEVVRRVGEANLAAPSASYKDLTLAFMAADPDFNGGLNYENEERAILQATRKAKNLNLWVDETGNLDSLTQRVVESGHCDMVHISCHGGYDPQLGFVLQLEDDYYRPQKVTANGFQNLARHIQCLFLSACHSAEVADTPSIALQLARMGISNVIGWDGSVADEDATAFAAEVYHSLLQQATIPYACAIARQRLLRQHLQTNKHPHWHLGRVFLAPNGGWPLIDSNKPSSPRRRGKNFHDLLDRKKKVVPVASKETFVGRRKETKQALKVFAENAAPGILLTGIGGSGKSSLAARIVHRMEPHYKAAIIYRDYSEIAILSELKQFTALDSRSENFQRYLADIQQNRELFSDNLVEILENHLAGQPIIVVVDDLEQHALEPLFRASALHGKVEVKPQYQNALSGLIEAFARADTQSRLLFTSRHNFQVLDQHGEDKAAELLEIEVHDMSPIEQEKHWLALLRNGAVSGVRDDVRDGAFLAQIWVISQGNPGLQDVLYQPLLKGEYRVLQAALAKLKSYHADLGEVVAHDKEDDVDKYLQRIALEAYHDALTDTERQCLRVLCLFDFAVPEELLIQAGPQLGIEDPRTAMQRLDNFGLLTHWQGEGLDGHISCYGLARKVVAPLSKEDKHFVATVCAPLLWQIWFSEFLQEYGISLTETFLENLVVIWKNYFPSGYAGELPLQTVQDQERIAYLHRLCINTSLTDWDAMNFGADEFIDLLELSLSLNTFEKLRVSSATLYGLSDFQLRELYEVFDDERNQFKDLIATESHAIILILLKQFSARTRLLAKAYQIYFGDLSADEKKKIESIDIRNEEDRHLAAIQLAKAKGHEALAYGNYANFLCNEKQDYAQAEVMYQRAVEADPNHADILGNYAIFLKNQKQDYVQAEVMYQRAVEVDPNDANNLGNYAIFLKNQKQDYTQAEVMYQRAVEADPNHANNLCNYAIFLAHKKQDYVQAEVMHQRAVEADPNDANILGHYANFLTDKKQDYAQAEVMYQRAVEADPNDANNLGNYALFLKNQKQDYEQAEVMYQRAVEADPNDANILGNYATFLADKKQDYAQAEVMCKRAVEADPNDANILGNYARLLFATNQKSQAQQHLEKAESQHKLLAPDLQVELAFYRCAHCLPHDLTPLKQQLQSGSRSLGWDLSANVKRASEDQHPHPELLAAIANVISGTQNIETLDQYLEWKKTP